MSALGQNVWVFGSLITLLLLWSLILKGYALWIAARKGNKWWFIALLIVNTVGILEIVYIFLVAKHWKKINPTVTIDNKTE